MSRAPNRHRKSQAKIENLKNDIFLNDSFSKIDGYYVGIKKSSPKAIAKPCQMHPKTIPNTFQNHPSSPFWPWTNTSQTTSDTSQTTSNTFQTTSNTFQTTFKSIGFYDTLCTSMTKHLPDDVRHLPNDVRHLPNDVRHLPDDPH